MVGQNQHHTVQNIHFTYDVLETNPTTRLGFFPCTRNFGKILATAYTAYTLSCVGSFANIRYILPTHAHILFIYTFTCRKDGTKATTRIRKVGGDMNLFLKELRACLEIPEPKNPRDDKIRVRVGGTIEVDGNYVRDIKTWLTGLGF